MSRSVPWRRTVSDTTSWRQDQAGNATIYILRNMGPTGFLLKEDGEEKNVKVFLGDPHSCTCALYKKERDLCKHICWVLLKKFRIPRQNPVTWQFGLVEREINELLRGQLTQETRPSAAARRFAAMASTDSEVQEEEENSGSQGMLKQRPISEEDVCPICQDELLAKRLPVTYCRFGCGNSVHIKCMKVWAEHQTSTGDKNIKCPFCREDFGPLSTLNQEMRNSNRSSNNTVQLGEHLGVVCKKCDICPVVGKCYKCVTCVNYHLCQACFNTPTHVQHSFEFRQRSNQRWRPAPDRSNVGSTILPDALVNNLMNREITEEDYDTLLQLDSQSSQQLSDLTEETVKSFPVERVRPSSILLAPGQQCRVCLRAYQQGQMVRRLPCKHKFHTECIDNWLLHRHPTCPVDGTVYSNESVHQMRQAERNRRQQMQQNSRMPGSGISSVNNRRNGPQVTHHSNSNITLEIPGVGIARLQGTPTNSGDMTRGRHIHMNYMQEHGVGGDGNNRSGSSHSSVSTLSAMRNNNGQGSRRQTALTHTTEVGGGMQSETPGEMNNAQQQLTSIGLSANRHGTVVDNVIRRLSRTLATAGRLTDHHGEDIVPQPPSIPLPHNDSLEISGQAGGSTPNSASRGTTILRKPPSGSSSAETDPGRRGRMRFRGIRQEARHPRSSSRSRERSGSKGQRSASRERRQGSDHQDPDIQLQGIFVGHNPSTNGPILGGTSTRFGGRLARSSKPTSEQHSDSRYRWGSTQHISGDDMNLAGSAVNRRGSIS